MDDLSEFKDLFIQAAREHVANLYMLIDRINSESSTQAIEDLHLQAHSLKGEAFAMRYNLFGNYVTVVEKFVKTIKENKSNISNSQRTIIRSAIDEMKVIIETLSLSDTEPDGIQQKIDVLNNDLDVKI